MTHTQEIVDSDASDLPYTPRGWRNLWYAIRDGIGITYGRPHKAGSLYFGGSIYPTKQDAENAAHAQMRMIPLGESASRWLGAFEVES